MNHGSSMLFRLLLVGTVCMIVAAASDAAPAESPLPSDATPAAAPAPSARTLSSEDAQRDGGGVGIAAAAAAVNASFWWFAPVISNSGYGHEAIEYLGELQKVLEAQHVLRHSRHTRRRAAGRSGADGPIEKGRHANPQQSAGVTGDADAGAAISAAATSAVDIAVQLSVVGCTHHGDEMLPHVLNGHEPLLRQRLLQMLRARPPRRYPFAAGFPSGGGGGVLPQRGPFAGGGLLPVSQQQQQQQPPAFVVCHSEPGAWWTPTPFYDTVECPTPWATVAVGRTMFETDRIPDGWPARLAYMREIWVPTEFHRATFEGSGVPPSKLFVIPESIDALGRWDPAKHPTTFFETHAMKKAGSRCHFKFLSVFKWEERKGWDVLLGAFFEAFVYPFEDPVCANDGRTPKQQKEPLLVCLFLKTSAYHSEVDDGDDDEYDAQVAEFLHKTYKKEMRLMRKQVNANQREPRWLQIHVISSVIPDDEFPSLYRAVDCVVQPSRGEGWGRPHMEAMAMGVPVIATNWSGNTAFMTETNSLLLAVERLVALPSGPFKGHRWAEPSRSHLVTLMRQAVDMKFRAKVTTGPEANDLQALGAVARRDIVTRYDNTIVAQLIVDRAVVLLEEALQAQRRRSFLPAKGADPQANEEEGKANNKEKKDAEEDDIAGDGDGAMDAWRWREMLSPLGRSETPTTQGDAAVSDEDASKPSTGDENGEL